MLRKVVFVKWKWQIWGRKGRVVFPTDGTDGHGNLSLQKLNKIVELFRNGELN